MPSATKQATAAVYLAVVERSRTPVFYENHAVPDTLDGRFELIVLHMFLVLHRLKGEPAASRFSQALFDLMFADMDRALREMGTGDLSVGKQVKRMASAFYGRTAAYEAGLGEPAGMAAALRRNLFGTVSPVDEATVTWFVSYIERQRDALRRIDPATIINGEIEFDAIG